MRTAAIFLLLCLPTLADDRLLLLSIAEVETGNIIRIGKAGETGAHQMTAAALSDHATALRHLAWVKSRLEAAGWPVTAYNVGLVWNAGLTRTLQRRELPRHRDYARRVSNLYEDYSKTHPSK